MCNGNRTKKDGAPSTVTLHKEMTLNARVRLWALLVALSRFSLYRSLWIQCHFANKYHKANFYRALNVAYMTAIVPAC